MMNDSIPIIRHATSADLAEIHAMQQTWEQEHTVWGYRANSREELQAMSPTMMWIVEIQGQVIGYALCQQAPPQERAIAEHNDTILEIEDLYIQPPYRNRGYGSQLVKAIETWGREHGYQKLLIYSSVKNLARILAFYQQQGFSGWNIRMFKPLS